jgi:hypothetical protein
MGKTIEFPLCSPGLRPGVEKRQFFPADHEVTGQL